ncbi:hypothetical protein FACS1894199_14790 [Bacteroidia bacterium]|nr:hypothetical protein FACS1894199_14790 [Bacteroidia bacterium]
METMTGVRYEKDTRGRSRYVRIDLDKCSVTMDELQVLLNEIMSNKRNRRAVSQVEEAPPYNPEFVAKIKQSDKDFKDGNYTVRAIEDLWK